MRILLLLLFPLLLAAQGRTVVIQQATVIDVTGAQPPRELSILIQGGVIRNVAASGSLTVPPGAEVIYGKGKFLIPGLWDSYVHMWHSQELLPLYLRYGVIGVRDMGSDINRTHAWKQAIQSGTLQGPTIISAGVPIDGPRGISPEMPVTAVGTPDQARTAVVERDDPRVEQVSILPGLPQLVYASLAERARNFRIPFGGPLPYAVSLSEAIDARQKSIDGLAGIVLSCAPKEVERRGRYSSAFVAGDAAGMQKVMAEALQEFDAQRAQGLFKDAARFGTLFTPALVYQQSLLQATDSSVANASTLELPASIAADVRRRWDLRSSAMTSPEQRKLLIQEARVYPQLLTAMKQAGVLVLPGSHTGEPYTVPGLALHAEMAALVQAGFTPQQVLRAATLDAADFLKRGSLYGSIEKGKVADLVLLDANPLEDIRNISRIRTVLQRGTVVYGVH